MLIHLVFTWFSPANVCSNWDRCRKHSYYYSCIAAQQYNHAECGFVSIFHLVATTGKVALLDPFARSIFIIAPKIALILLGRVLLLSPSVSLCSYCNLSN